MATLKQKVERYEQFFSELQMARCITLNNDRVVELLNNAHSMHIAKQHYLEDPSIKNKRRADFYLNLLSARKGEECQ